MADNAVRRAAPPSGIISVDAGRARRSRFRLRDGQGTAANLILAVGAALTIVGLVELALLWYPLRLGNVAWEFGTLSTTLDELPLTVLGVALVTLGLIVHPRLGGTWVRAAAVFWGVAALLFVALGALYGLSALEVVGRAPEESIGVLGRAVVKNAAQIVAYFVASGFLAVICWRGVERER
jgi:hypothetical protein